MDHSSGVPAGVASIVDVADADVPRTVDIADVNVANIALKILRNRATRLGGLISLVSPLPAPQKVRAAAFQAIASYPNVKSLGAVKGGQGLLISFGEGTPASLVVDPATSQTRETNFFVSADGARYSSAGSGADLGFALVAEWTNLVPK
jgi:hypothetical protein